MKYCNNKILFFSIICLMVLSASCLKRNLPDLPLFDLNQITQVRAEHRFNGTQMVNGQPVVVYQPLAVTQQINAETNTINVQIRVPAATGQFTAAEREKVVQNNIWFYFTISTAATMLPVEGTTKPGDPTDATKPLKYEVTAANGAKRVWTVNVTAFNK